MLGELQYQGGVKRARKLPTGERVLYLQDGSAVTVAELVLITHFGDCPPLGLFTVHRNDGNVKNDAFANLWPVPLEGAPDLFQRITGTNLNLAAEAIRDFLKD